MRHMSKILSKVWWNNPDSFHVYVGGLGPEGNPTDLKCRVLCNASWKSDNPVGERPRPKMSLARTSSCPRIQGTHTFS